MLPEKENSCKKFSSISWGIEYLFVAFHFKICIISVF
jgi:hypothetical protein